MPLHGLTGLMAASGLDLYFGGDHHRLDGAPGDTVTLADAHGTTVYADLDGDGVIDHISSVHHDGGYDVFTADPHRAAWGLAGDIPGNGRVEGPRSWGLALSGPPESGSGNEVETSENPGWRRIEHG